MDEHFKRMNTYKGPKVEPASEPKEEPAQNITDPLAASLASAAFAETATPETARAEPPQVVEYSASDDATDFSAAAEAACV